MKKNVKVSKRVLKQARKYVKQAVEDAQDEIKGTQERIEQSDNERAIRMGHETIRAWEMIKGRAEQNLNNIDEVLDDVEG